MCWASGVKILNIFSFLKLKASNSPRLIYFLKNSRVLCSLTIMDESIDISFIHHKVSTGMVVVYCNG